MFSKLKDRLSKLPISYDQDNESRLSHRVRLFDPHKYEIVHSNNTHDQYDCPYCLSVRGHADDDGRFYWDRSKLIGWCHKCETVGILKSDKDVNKFRLELAINSIRKLLDSTYLVPNFTFSEIPYHETFDELDNQAIEYLDSRVPFYSMLKDYFEFRCLDTGVTVPIYFQGKIVSYNLRFYSPKGKMKYFIPNGAKFLYSPTRVFDGKLHQEITLVEGVFDAIGALLDNKPNPVAVFGVHLTDLQKYMIRSCMPSKINIYLDDWELSRKLLDKVRGNFPTCSRVEVIPSWGDDPEEIFKKRVGRMNDIELDDLSKRIELLVRDKV